MANENTRAVTAFPVFEQASMPAVVNWAAAAYGGGKFVAIASGTREAAYSADGKEWRRAQMPVSAEWKSVAYGNGRFVAVADKTMAAYSLDGETWTGFTLPVTELSAASVAYGGGRFVVVGRKDLGATGNYNAAYSTDGVTWRESAWPATGFAPISLAYGNGRFVALSYNTAKMAYSDNGVNWKETSNPGGYWVDMVYGKDRFVAVRSNAGSRPNRIVYSKDGLDWVSAGPCPEYASWGGVAYGNGKYLAVQDRSDSLAAYSEDGEAFESVTTPISARWSAAAYGDGRFVVIGTNTDMALYCDEWGVDKPDPDEPDPDQPEPPGPDGPGIPDGPTQSTLWLITDRTQRHVDRLRELSAKGWQNMSYSEQQEWLHGGDTEIFWLDGEQVRGIDGIWYLLGFGTNKGAYNIEDYNRVGAAVEYIAERFKALGISFTVAPKTDWKRPDIPTPAQQTTYLNNVRTLRGLVSVYPTTPQVPPDMEGLTWQEANEIEKILLDLDELIIKAQAVYQYTGEAITGGVLI